MTNDDKVKILAETYSQQIDEHDFAEFAVSVIRECGAVAFKKVEKIFSEEGLSMDLTEYIKPYYTIEDGVVFSADKKRLIKYSPEKTDATYKIPACVETISDEAFQDNEYLQQVTICDNVSHIGSRAFRNCTLLSKIIWGKVKSAGSEVFVNCPRLKTVCVDDVNHLWNYTCDNLGSPFINGADLYVNGELCQVLTVPKDVSAGTLRAFKGCRSIQHIRFDANNEYIENSMLRLLKHKEKSNIF